MSVRLALALMLIAAPLAAQQRAPATHPAAPPAAPLNRAPANAVPAVPPQSAPATQRPGAAPVHPAPAPATPQHPAPPAAPGRPGAPATPLTAAQQRAAHGDSAVDSTAMPIDYRREVYNYQGASRDPFASLLTDASVQTSINDLRLVSVLYDPRGGRSIAVLLDKNTPTPRRLRVGQTLGRLRVIQIRPYEVVFQIEEFGFERQEVLTLQRPEANR